MKGQDNVSTAIFLLCLSSLFTMVCFTTKAERTPKSADIYYSVAWTAGGVLLAIAMFLGIHHRVWVNKARKAYEAVKMPDISPYDKMKLKSCTSFVIRNSRYNGIKPDISLCNAVVASKKTNHSGIVIIKLILDYHDRKDYWEALVYEGTAPDVGDVVWLNVASLHQRIDKASDIDILDIDILCELDFDWDKLRENFNYSEEVIC